jgi:LruC domain-containing protein
MKNKSIALTLVALSVCASLVTKTIAALTPSSMQLTDTVQGGSGVAAGTGAIDVFKGKSITLTGSDLDAFRADSVDGKTLIFAVDVNENASGLETARAQGVAIKSANITVTYPGNVTQVFSKFWTETQAMVAQSGATTGQRLMRYTLLGDAGSNEITGRKIGTTVYDSTLKFMVDQSLATATKVTLNITLLKTDAALGDPENFYDYSGGFEDVALINYSDAKIFDVYVPYAAGVAFRTEAPNIELSPEGVQTVTDAYVATGGTTTTTTADGTTTTVTIPPLNADGSTSTTTTLIGTLGANGYLIAGYEDNFPDKGDYDFNDVVVAYKVFQSIDANGKVTAISGDAYLVARGAGGYTHRWTLAIPVPANTSIVGNTCLTINGADPNSGCSIGMNSNASAVNFVGFENTYKLMAQMNTGASDSPSPSIIPHSTFSFQFQTPMDPSTIGSLDPFIEISRNINTAVVPSTANGNTRVVHMGTKDSANNPYAMMIPSDWQVPVEGTDIGLAYPKFADFVSSQGQSSKDWYLPVNANPNRVVQWKISQLAQ